MIHRIGKNDITGLAAQLAFFFLLSLFPLLIFLVTLIPFLPIRQEDLLGLARDFAPDPSYHLIESTLNEVMAKRNGGLLSFGIIGALWSASKGMNAVVKALNRAYYSEERRPFFIARGMSVILTIGMIIVVLVALLLPVFGKQIDIYLFSYLGFSSEFVAIWNSLRWTVAPMILFIVFLSLYIFAPNEKVKLTSAIPGAIFATIGWIVVSLGFSYYVGNVSNYTATYGSLGGIIVLMLWFYLSGIILLVGGEINALLVEKQKKV